MCMCGCVLFIKKYGIPTQHISQLKYAPTHGTFQSFLEFDKTTAAYSLQIYYYLTLLTSRFFCRVLPRAGVIHPTGKR